MDSLWPATSVIFANSLITMIGMCPFHFRLRFSKCGSWEWKRENEGKGGSQIEGLLLIGFTTKVSWPFLFGWVVLLSKYRLCGHSTFHQQAASILEVDVGPTK